MRTLFKNGYIFTKSGFLNSDLILDNNTVSLSKKTEDSTNFDNIVDCTNLYITPGFVDVHVHFREPGFSYKETIQTGSNAGAVGGYTVVATMPNVKPAPSNLGGLKMQLDLIQKDSKIHIIPYGTITQKGIGQGELSQMKQMRNYVIGYSDDGRGIQTQNLMQEAMNCSKDLDKIIVAHCEDDSLLQGGYIHKGVYSQKNNHKGICSESEFSQVFRDTQLSKLTKAKYHVCHISTKETVDIIRKAKNMGIDVTCETAPHYLILCDEDLKEEGRYKMNPPIRGKDDKEALIQGILDGTIDMIATDHAPHTQEEKSKGLENSPFGIVGLEIAFSLMYTHMIDKKIISLEKLIELMCVNPRKRFEIDKLIDNQKILFDNDMNFEIADEIIDKNIKKIQDNYYIHDGMSADFNILNIDETYKIDSSKFVSKGKATPFDKETVKGKVIMTVVDGQIVYKA